MDIYRIRKLSNIIEHFTICVIPSTHLLYSNTYYVSEGAAEKSADEAKEHRFVYTQPTGYYLKMIILLV